MKRTGGVAADGGPRVRILLPPTRILAELRSSTDLGGRGRIARVVLRSCAAVGLVARDSLPPYTPWICAIQPALSHVATFQVLNAVYGHISRWISQGTLPPTAPRVDVLSEGPPIVLNRTSLGLATGGIQPSQQAVPTAVENAINSGPGLCFPLRVPYALRCGDVGELYQNHHAYVSAVSDVNNDNVKAGYILSEDAEVNIFEAAHSGILKR